jgi:hypothetical protein
MMGAISEDWRVRGACGALSAAALLCSGALCTSFQNALLSLIDLLYICLYCSMLRMCAVAAS